MVLDDYKQRKTLLFMGGKEMKKQLLIISLVLVLVLMLSATVLAQPVRSGAEDKGALGGFVDSVIDRPETLPSSVLVDAEERVNNSRVKHEVKSEVRGLENAVIHVDNEFAVGAITRAMERFQEREQFRYDEYDVVEVDGNLVVKAKRNVRFLGFLDLKFEDVYELNAEGEVLREKRTMWSKLFDREVLEEAS